MSGLDVALYVVAGLLLLLHLSTWTLLWRRRHAPQLRGRSSWLTAVACTANFVLTAWYLFASLLTGAGASCASWLWVLAAAWPAWTVSVLLRSMRLWWAWEAQRGAIRETELRRQTRAASMAASYSATGTSQLSHVKTRPNDGDQSVPASTWIGLERNAGTGVAPSASASLVSGAELTSTVAVTAERKRMVLVRICLRSGWLLAAVALGMLVMLVATIPVAQLTQRYAAEWRPTVHADCPAGLGWETLPVYGACLLTWLVGAPLIYVRLRRLPRGFGARAELIWCASVSVLHLVATIATAAVTLNWDFSEHAAQPLPPALTAWHIMCLVLGMLWALLRPALLADTATPEHAKALAVLYAAAAADKPRDPGPAATSSRTAAAPDASPADGDLLAPPSTRAPRPRRPTRGTINTLSTALSNITSSTRTSTTTQVSAAGFERFLLTLDNRRQLTLFRDFSVRDFSVENVLFYEHCHRLHRLLLSPDGVDVTLLTGETREIVYLFLQPGAPYEVNISGSVRTELRQASRSGMLGIRELEKAKREVARLMYQHTYPRFVRWRKEMGLPIEEEGTGCTSQASIPRQPSMRFPAPMQQTSNVR
ncbi:hypothetical protein THASP1DRAFT_27507 [Thamnocephalis sphaerospora]|uniref:RGS domain-containing protein n=1 Tax=Thamnocephalis sphaerospora TaxID=78915 RepID=A0A4V1IXD8_9FUNG|nr:hypothetical protein THASP1DRAFT_27507 [Thamnocephalis sphaerospora]|eukprot:RKP10709.1 hypothetical protein THASP1DRAFT_27507 [Thamnocephalis sphaerospora]